MLFRNLLSGITTILIFSTWPNVNALEAIEFKEKAPEAVIIRDVVARDHAISGQVENRSPHPVRDVELLVRYTWVWKDEFDPGPNPPGRAVYLTLEEKLAPGESTVFRHTPQDSLPLRDDGHFEIKVTVAGFTKLTR